jgi:HKD family nuclease
LKESGLKKLLPEIENHIKNNRRITIIAGLNFGFTDPSALENLLFLFRENKRTLLYITKAETSTKIFHPKLYISKLGADYTIISGSANITNGGLVSNAECSLKIVANETDKVCQDALSFFDMLKKKQARLATDKLIEKYKLYWEKQQDAIQDSKSIPEVDEAPGRTKNYFQLKLGQENNLASYCYEHKFIGVGYHMNINFENESAKVMADFNKKYKEAFEIKNPDEKQKATIATSTIWKICKVLKEDDIIICPDENDNYLVGKVNGLYRYKEGDRLMHQREMTWFSEKTILKSHMPQEIIASINRPTIVDLNYCWDKIEALMRGEDLSKI